MWDPPMRNTKGPAKEDLCQQHLELHIESGSTKHFRKQSQRDFSASERAAFHPRRAAKIVIGQSPSNQSHCSGRFGISWPLTAAAARITSAIDRACTANSGFIANVP
jgi:hypothetical protein